MASSLGVSYHSLACHYSFKCCWSKAATVCLTACVCERVFLLSYRWSIFSPDLRGLSFRSSLFPLSLFSTLSVSLTLSSLQEFRLQLLYPQATFFFLNKFHPKSSLLNTFTRFHIQFPPYALLLSPLFFSCANLCYLL